MADLTITAANVIAQNGVQRTGIAGATITAGQMVYKEASTGKYKLADADSATQEVQETVGMALHASLAGQPLTILEAGDVALGSILTAGDPYYLSATAGGIAPAGDLATGDEINLIGLAKSATVLTIKITRPGVTHA